MEGFAFLNIKRFKMVDYVSSNHIEGFASLNKKIVKMVDYASSNLWKVLPLRIKKKIIMVEYVSSDYVVGMPPIFFTFFKFLQLVSAFKFSSLLCFYITVLLIHSSCQI